MTLEEQLKQEIVSRHGSVSAFSKSIGLSNSTVDSILSRGLYNAGVGRVMQIFDALGIDTESLAVGRIVYAKEKTPAPSEDSAEAQFSKLEIETVLVSLGFIQDGEHITDSDLRFINGILDIVDAWFENRHQQG